MDKEKQNEYVIGVDAGATKTTIALADLKGKILVKSTVGGANPRNIGIKKAVENVAQGIEKVLTQIKKKQKNKKQKILSTYIGLPATEEEFKFKKIEIKKELLKHKKIAEIFKGKVNIGSDQIVAFYSGVSEKDGIVLIAGTGSVVHGWHGRKDVKIGGWGWLADTGSATWIGRKAFQAIFKDLDGRGPKTLMAKLALKKFKIINNKDLLAKIYQGDNTVKILASFSILADEAAQKGDKTAKQIIEQAADELIVSAVEVISRMGFKDKSFSLVLTGGMFKSEIILNIVKKEIKKFASQIKFIQPEVEPATGAIKLALERLKVGNKNF